MHKQQILYHPLKVQGGIRVPFSTGSLHIDLTLLTGGVLPGDLVEITGPTASGKTVFCQHIAASAQLRQLPVVWIDSDLTFDLAFARRCGIDPNLLYLTQPRNAEQALDTLVTLSGCTDIGVIILDSLDTLIPRREQQSGGYGLLEREDFSALQDELIAQALAAVWQQTQRSLTTILYTHASPSKQSGSYHRLSERHARMAPGLRASVRLRLEPEGPIFTGGLATGLHVGVHCLRSPKARQQDFPRAATLFGEPVSLNFPFQRRIDLDIMYNQGIVKAGEIFDFALGLGLIAHQGGRFVWEDRDLGSERSESIRTIENQGLSAGLESAVRRKLLW